MSITKIQNYETILTLCKPEVISMDDISKVNRKDGLRVGLGIPRGLQKDHVARHGTGKTMQQDVALPTKGCVDPMIGNHTEENLFVGLPATDFAHRVLFSDCHAVSLGYNNIGQNMIEDADDRLLAMNALQTGLSALTAAEDQMIYGWLRNRSYNIASASMIGNNSFSLPLTSPSLYPVIAPTDYFVNPSISPLDTIRSFVKGIKTVAKASAINLVMGTKALSDFLKHNEIQALLGRGSLSNFGAAYGSPDLLRASISSQYSVGAYEEVISPAIFVGSLPSTITGGRPIQLYVANDSFCVYEKAVGWQEGDTFVETPWLGANEMFAYGADRSNAIMNSHPIHSDWTEQMGLKGVPVQYTVEPLLERKFENYYMVGMNFRMSRSLYINPQAFHVGVVTSAEAAAVVSVVH